MTPARGRDILILYAAFMRDWEVFFTEDVIIVGAGPAGLAAALQLRRCGRKARLFEGARPGGLLLNADRVENYPGFPGGVSGPDLAQAFLTQVAACDVTVTPETVLALTWQEGLFRARTPAGVYHGRAAVVASGTHPRLLTGFAIPEALRGCVAYEVAGLLGLAGKQVVIVGAGDAAFDYALNLGKRNSVIILNRGDRVNCLPLLWERAQACPAITHRPDTAVVRLDVRPEGGMTVECSSPHGPLAFPADHLIGAVGRDPHRGFLSASLSGQSSELEDRGILQFVGDVKNGMFRQTAIAVGDGVRAGMRIARALSESPR